MAWLIFFMWLALKCKMAFNMVNIMPLLVWLVTPEMQSDIQYGKHNVFVGMGG